MNYSKIESSKGYCGIWEASGNIGTGRPQVGQVCPKNVNYVIHACEMCTFEYGPKIKVLEQKKPVIE